MMRFLLVMAGLGAAIRVFLACFLLVMAGLGPAIRVFVMCEWEDANGRHKAGHDV